MKTKAQTAAATGASDPPSPGWLSIAQALISGLYDPAVVLNAELGLAAHNPPFVKVVGLNRADLSARAAQGHDLFQLLGACDGSDRAAAKRCLESGEVVRLAEVPSQNASGSEFVAWYAFIPIPGQNGRPAGLVVIIRDVSSEVKLFTRYKDQLALSESRAAELERVVQRRTQELRTALEEVSRLSKVDALTRLMNRRSFSEAAAQTLEKASNDSESVGLILIDLDFFKRLNDTYGHKAGDETLIACAASLRTVVPESAHVARFGGEEFVVLISNCGQDGALDIAERCCEAIAGIPMTSVAPGKNKPQTASIGVALFPQHGRTVDELFAAADAAMYVAKNNGRHQVRLFESQPADRESVPAPSNLRPNVLVVASEREQQEQLLELLSTGYHVLTVSSASDARGYCRREAFDVVVVDHDLHDQSGLEFLGDSLGLMPGALRILSIENQAFFMQLRGLSLAHVDQFILREELRDHLLSAIEDGLARRDLLRERLFSTPPRSGPSSYHVTRVQRLMDEEAFGVAYQPIVYCSDRSRFGFEALCRPHSVASLGPEELFEAAMRGGLIWKLGQIIRRRAATLFSENQDDDDGILFINLHPAELNDPELLLHEESLHQWSNRIVLEITERASISDFSKLKELIVRLRRRGYRFAIDDLGSGYASLNSVALLSPDFIKVDMDIIRDIDKSTTKMRLVRRIIDFANDEGIRIVAEGIEREGEAHIVTELGCHLMQGYLLGRPKLTKSESEESG